MVHRVNTRAKARLTKTDIDALERVMDLMLSRKIFHVEVGDVKLECSQYAFAPPTMVAPVPPNRPVAPEAFLNQAVQAFRPWAATTTEAPVYADPVDPASDLDDERLFATDLPREH